jgi:phage tail-like protein
MATSKRNDPLPLFAFYVQFVSLQGTDKTFFKSVGGLRYETEVVPIKAGGANDTVFNLVGGMKWSNIVLKQGFTSGSGLLAWRDAWTKGNMKRTDGSIIQLDTALTETAKWEFVRAWPVKWEIGEFDAAKNELAIESLELCHEGLKYTKLR